MSYLNARDKQYKKKRQMSNLNNALESTKYGHSTYRIVSARMRGSRELIVIVMTIELKLRWRLRTTQNTDRHMSDRQTDKQTSRQVARWMFWVCAQLSDRFSYAGFIYCWIDRQVGKQVDDLVKDGQLKKNRPPMSFLKLCRSSEAVPEPHIVSY